MKTIKLRSWHNKEKEKNKKLPNGLKLLFICSIVTAGYILLPQSYIFASEGGVSWRPTYDLIMKWVNFLILVLLLIKFLKKPIIEFLNKSKKEVTMELDDVLSIKKKLDREIQESYKKLEESDLAFQKMGEKITEIGERKKQEIIEKANQNAEFMLKSAKRRVNGYLIDARTNLQNELIDEAVAYAIEKFPEEITNEDNNKLIDNFLEKANK